MNIRNPPSLLDKDREINNDRGLGQFKKRTKSGDRTKKHEQSQSMRSCESSTGSGYTSVTTSTIESKTDNVDNVFRPDLSSNSSNRINDNEHEEFTYSTMLQTYEDLRTILKSKYPNKKERFEDVLKPLGDKEEAKMAKFEYIYRLFFDNHGHGSIIDILFYQNELRLTGIVDSFFADVYRDWITVPQEIFKRVKLVRENGKKSKFERYLWEMTEGDRGLTVEEVLNDDDKSLQLEIMLELKKWGWRRG